MSVGDTVELRFVDVDPGTADRPAPESTPSDNSERRVFEMARAKYFALKDKYE